MRPQRLRPEALAPLAPLPLLHYWFDCHVFFTNVSLLLFSYEDKMSIMDNPSPLTADVFYG